MDREALAMGVLRLVSDLNAAEEVLVNAQLAVAAAKSDLADIESKLLLTGIDGKNQDVRDAQLRQRTAPQIFALEQAKNNEALLRLTLTKLQNEMSAYRVVAMLLGEKL